MGGNPQVGRALSGLLQAVLAQEITHDEGAAARAMALEFADDIAAAAAQGQVELQEFWHDAWVSMTGASLELIRRGIAVHDDDPRVFLPVMIREQRKADRSV